MRRAEEDLRDLLRFSVLNFIPARGAAKAGPARLPGTRRDARSFAGKALRSIHRSGIGLALRTHVILPASA